MDLDGGRREWKLTEVVAEVEGAVHSPGGVVGGRGVRLPLKEPPGVVTPGVVRAKRRQWRHRVLGRARRWIGRGACARCRVACGCSGRYGKTATATRKIIVGMPMVTSWWIGDVVLLMLDFCQKTSDAKWATILEWGVRTKLMAMSTVYMASRWGRRRPGKAPATWLGTMLWPVTQIYGLVKIVTVTDNGNLVTKLRTEMVFTSSDLYLW